MKLLKNLIENWKFLQLVVCTDKWLASGWLAGSILLISNNPSQKWSRLKGNKLFFGLS